MKCNGEISDPIGENIGVKQGDNASPISFRRYLSDIKEYLDGYTRIYLSDEIIVHVVWANDLYMVSCNPAHAQRQLDGLSWFCATNQMLANETKTKYMVSGKETHFSLNLNGSDLSGISLTAQQSVDKVFRWFMKLMLHVKQNTSNVMLVGEVDMFPASVLVIGTL